MLQQQMIYQVGDLVLHAHHRTATQRTFQARGTSSEMQDTYRTITATSEHKTSIRTETADILLYSNGVYSPAYMAEILKSQVGVFQDIISYVNVNPESSGINEACSCALCGCCQCQILWLHNTGVLKSITTQPVDLNTYSATLTFELHSYWKPLNRLLWSVGSLGVSRPLAKRDFYAVNTTQTLIMNYPTCEMLSSRCMQFYKNHFSDLKFLYDPYWQLQLNCNLPDTYPQIGYARYWSAQKHTAIIHIHKWLWSAPPLSIYSFMEIKNLDTKARIHITRQEANREMTDIITINFARINNLASQNEVVLRRTDILQVGDIFGFAHIIRNGEVILHCADAVNRKYGDFPGYLTPGTNTVRVFPKGANAAMSHIFRSL